MTVTIRAATKADIEGFSGVPLARTVRAFVAEKDGALVGIGGLAYYPDHVLAFSEITDPLREHKTTIWRVCRRIVDMMKNCRAPVYAVRNPDEPTAGALLERMGFALVGKERNGEVYVWRH
jgi:hypothetical protein